MNTSPKTRIDWIPLITELPPDECFVLLTGDSGYTTVDNFVVVGRRYESYRPRLADGAIRWLNIGDDSLTDYGWKPTHWAPLPNWPESHSRTALEGVK